jgi:cytosine/adenosine deaminase-related metal-dependent hydrolase
MSKRYVLYARSIITISSGVIHDGAIVVDRGRIAAIGTRSHISKTFASDRAIDLGDRVIMPALVDAHTHITLDQAPKANPDLRFQQWLFGIMNYRKKLSNDELFSISSNAIDTLIRNGITTIGDSDPTLIPMDAAISKNYRGVFFIEVFGITASLQLLAIYKYKRTLGKGLKVSSEQVRHGISPHAPYTVTPSVFRFASAYAKWNKLPVSVHVAEMKDEIEFLNSGSGNFRQLFGFASKRIPVSTLTPLKYVAGYNIMGSSFICVHGVHLSDDEFRLLAENESHLVTCPSSNRNLESGFLDIIKPLNAGVNLCVGTDSPASSDGCDLFHELRLSLRCDTDREVKIDPVKALEFITINPARALGFDSEVGTLDAGKSADLIAIDPGDSYSEKDDIHDLIVHKAKSEDISLTVSRGEIRYSNEFSQEA